MNKKNLLLWSLYDFANSFVFINFLLYFSQWVILDGGLSDFWYNALFPIASILLLASSPTLASFNDKFGGRLHFLKYSTLGTLLGYGSATFFAYLGQPIALIATSFLIGQYFYQLSFSFHNPMIEDVADIDHRSRASGIGQFSNSLGQVLGLVLAIPFASSRLAPLFPSIIVFAILSLPIFLWFKESKPRVVIYSMNSFVSGTKNFYKDFKFFLTASIAVPILVSFFFFNDALITVSNNYSIYLENVFGVPDITKNVIMLIVLLLSAVGGLLWGKIGDKIGTLKSLEYILLAWVILLPTLAIVRTIPQVIVCSALLGFFMGGIWTVTRSYLSQTLKKEELGYGFSFYTLFERFATFVGPLTWGGIVTLSGATASSYRISMIVMTMYIVVGLVLVHYWKRNKIEHQNQ